MINKNLKPFCEQHSIHILDTNKRAYRHNKINTTYFQHSEDYNLINRSEIYGESEPLYTLEISESELERIANFESQVFNNMKEHSHYNMVETIMEQKRKESELRNKYSAVRKAYENYSLMLKLAQSGEL